MIAGSLLQPPREGGLARGIWIMSKPVVLITGALTGIGRATAVAFATEGARLVVSGRHEEAGQALAAELRGLGVEAAFIRADVRREDEVSRLVSLNNVRPGSSGGDPTI